MSNINQVSIHIPEADLQEILAAIVFINQKVKPFEIALTNKERMSIVKMGDKSFPFVKKANEYVKSAPELVPNYLNIAEFDKDVKAYQDLSSIYQLLSPLYNIIKDTRMLAGSEANKSAMMFYKAVKTAADNKVVHAKGIYVDLKKRYDSYGKKVISNPKGATDLPSEDQI